MVVGDGKVSVLAGEMWASASGYWTGAKDYQRFLYAAAVLLLLSGAIHAGVYAVEGGAWEGPVSWRKPILFGFSFGVFCLAMAWVMGSVCVGRVWGWLMAGNFAVSSVSETALITLQRWRGVPSHFNDETIFDAVVLLSMATFVGFVALGILVLTALTWLRLESPPSFAWAIRTGMALLVAGQILGVLIILNGNRVLEAGGAEPTIFGVAGVMKVPHAVALHGIQILPLLAWLLSFGVWSERRRVRVVAMACVGYAGLVVVHVVQTFGGLAPLDLGLPNAVLFGASAGLVGVAYVAALLALRRRVSGPGPEITSPAGS